MLERGFNRREVRLGDLWRDLGMAQVELGDLGQRAPAAVIVPRLASVAPGYITRCCQAPR